MLAAGIDPAKSLVFVQSEVPQHAELAWVLGIVARMGWLNRMTQFKSKSGKDQEGAPVGLFTYPVLMAADILVYGATHVPVGDDQRQHLELARDLAGAANRRWDTDCFVVPEAEIEGFARVMSLQDGTSKMSKSSGPDSGRIHLTDPPEAIVRKIKKAKTDAIPKLYYDAANRPEVSNLLGIYAAMSDTTIQEAETEVAGLQTGAFKAQLGELIVSKLCPISEEMERLRQSPCYVDEVLRDGADKARGLAEETMERVREAVGIG